MHLATQGQVVEWKKGPYSGTVWTGAGWGLVSGQDPWHLEVEDGGDILVSTFHLLYRAIIRCTSVVKYYNSGGINIP